MKMFMVGGARAAAPKPKSMHFEPGTWVVYNNERFLLLCYRDSDGKMVLDNERTTVALDTYSMQWR